MEKTQNKIGFGPGSFSARRIGIDYRQFLGYSRRWSTNGSSAREWRTRRYPGQRIDPDVRMLTPGAVRSKWWKP